MNRIICIQVFVSLFVSVSFGQKSSTSGLEIIPVEQETLDISLVITDNYHVNTRSSAMIYDGDAIQFGIDEIRSGISVEYSGSILNRFREIIDARMHASPHPLYTRNLQSINAIVVDEWNKAMIRLLKKYLQKIKNSYKNEKAIQLLFGYHVLC
ncbi:MAG: hypothetical protein KAR19_03870 [Bacteroidales bacterium]|nr:hypothetical protein [Bacteroidales bacterium]